MTSITDVTRLATPTKDHCVGETTPCTDRTVMVITTRPTPPPPPDDYHQERRQMQDAYRSQIHRMCVPMKARRQVQDAYLSQIHHMITMNPGNQQEGHGSIHQSICFPMKLYRVLAMASEFGFDHIISWKTDNRAFIIHDKVEFIRTILPQ
jgi:HSF-type DNA-binding